MIFEFWCRKCEKDVGEEQYHKCRFCPDCDTLLEKRIKGNVTIVRPRPQPPIDVPIDEIDLELLFTKYLEFSPIAPGSGIVFSSVDAWISARKEAYVNFRKRFSIEKLLDFECLKRNFKNWLLFQNNLSWTTLQRTGYKALDDPEGLAKLIMLLKNEDLDIEVRVRRGLKGEEKVNGIGPGILTGLLHTFFDDKYCVWNTRTKDTLKILRRPPAIYRNIGDNYNAVNDKLHEMAKDLNTDLTTIDGFMWFISKHVRFI